MWRGSRAMSSTAKVWVDENTKVICQGFTGKQVSGVALSLTGASLTNGQGGGGVWGGVAILRLTCPTHH